jgi:hypothetical protein
MKKDKPFNNAIYVRTDDLPDEYHQQIIELTEKIMVNVHVDFKAKKECDPNIAMAALQRALGLTMAKVFHKSELPRMIVGLHKALVDSANEWSEHEP